MKRWGVMGLYVTDYAESQTSLDPRHYPKDCQVLLESHYELNLPKDPKLHAHESESWSITCSCLTDFTVYVKDIRVSSFFIPYCEEMLTVFKEENVKSAESREPSRLQYAFHNFAIAVLQFKGLLAIFLEHFGPGFYHVQDKLNISEFVCNLSSIAIYQTNPRYNFFGLNSFLGQLLQDNVTHGV